MISNPRRSGLGRIGMQRVFGETVLLSELREESRAFMFLGLGDETGLLPPWISPHLLETRDRLPKQGIVETASRFKVRSQVLGLLRIHPQGEFDQEGRRLALLHAFFALCACSSACSTNHKTSLLNERLCCCADKR